MIRDIKNYITNSTNNPDLNRSWVLNNLQTLCAKDNMFKVDKFAGGYYS